MIDLISGISVGNIDQATVEILDADGKQLVMLNEPLSIHSIRVCLNITSSCLIM